MTIERSAGIPIAGTHYIAGGGYRGLTDELDTIVAEAAVRLEAWSGMDVTIRFNSDRKSGSAWLLTDPVDGVWKNAELGVGGGVGLEPSERLYISVTVDPVCLRNPDAHDLQGWSKLTRLFDTLDDAFAFVAEHATTERLHVHSR